MWKSPAKLRFIIHRIACRKQQGRRVWEKEEASIQILHEQKMWIKHEWMKVWKLNSTVLCSEQEKSRKMRESSFRSCTQALSADLCQSVPYEAPLWAELLLVHYGWGAILRHLGCWFLIFWVEGDDIGWCQILSWGMYRTWWVQTYRYGMCSNHRHDPCLKYAHPA